MLLILKEGCSVALLYFSLLAPRHLQLQWIRWYMTAPLHHRNYKYIEVNYQKQGRADPGTAWRNARVLQESYRRDTSERVSTNGWPHGVRCLGRQNINVSTMIPPVQSCAATRSRRSAKRKWPRALTLSHSEVCLL